MPRVKVISIFFALAMIVQLGYYFDFIEFVEFEKGPLYDFRSTSIPSSPPSLLSPLHTLCDRTKWSPNTYINCSDISMPALSAINQLQVCIRWAIDSGINIVRPTFITYDNVTRQYPNYLLNEEYLWQSLNINCPSMKVVESRELNNVSEIEGDTFFFGKRYRGKGSYHKYVVHKVFQNPPPEGAINSVLQERGSLGGWERKRDKPAIQTSFKSLFRFSPNLIDHATQILSTLPHTFFGVHLRSDDLSGVLESAANSNIYLEGDNERDEVEEAIAWVLARNTTTQPHVYVACDDAGKLAAFIDRARACSILATHKFTFNSSENFIQGDSSLFSSLTVDQLRVVDHIVLSRASFFVGTGGSVDSFMLGQSRHWSQFEQLDYHGKDDQQYLLGPGISWWSGATW